MHALDQAISYYRRVSAAPAGSLLYHTIQDQQRHNLKWWVTMSGVENSSIQEMKQQFMGLCDTYKLCHSKTQFLASSKTKFGMQRYVQLMDSFQSRRTWAKLRGSVSCLAIETRRGGISSPPLKQTRDTVLYAETWVSLKSKTSSTSWEDALFSRRQGNR